MSEARELLAQVVAEKGADYVYDGPRGDEGMGCLYFAGDGRPACIIGHVLAAKGYGPADVREGSVAGPLLGQLDLFTTRERYALTAAQAAQDLGQPWGEALQEFDRALTATAGAAS